jgi:capsular exopolysaccharide synthesis family protein
LIAPSNEGGAAAAEPVFAEGEIALGDVSPITAAFLSTVSDVGEGLRAVGTLLRLGFKGKQFRTLAVTSVVEGDGKTSVTVGLGAALANAGQRVLLIDADLRRRSVAPMLAVPPGVGLAEWLEGSPSALPTRRIADAGFHLLSAGVRAGRPELLGARRMTDLLNAAQRRFDIVILDCAPLLPVSDSLGLKEQVDGFLMVVRARHTPRKAVGRAIALLGRRRVAGLVMNAFRSRIPMHRGYGYGSYHYGSHYKAYPKPDGT